MLNNDSYKDLVRLTWTPVDLEECIGLKRTDLSVEENKFQVDDHNNIKRYLSTENEGNGQYELICYSKEGSEDKSIAVIRDLNGKHLLSINGIDCSYSMTLQEKFLVSIIKGEEKEKVMLYLGLTKRVHHSMVYKCQFEVCTGAGDCDPQPKFSYDLKTTDHWFGWSEAGLKIEANHCPSLEMKGPCGKPGDCSQKQKYVMMFDKDTKQYYTLECYQSLYKQESNTYYLMLKSTKGYHIHTIKLSNFACDRKGYFINNFYVRKHSKETTVVFKMHENTNDHVIESCWGKTSNEEQVEIWFYAFLIDYEHQKFWKESDMNDENCPSIPKTYIEFLSEEPTLDGLIAEYKNRRQNQVELSCYKKGDTYYAIIKNTKNERLKIKNVCSNKNPVENLYIDLEELVTVVGTVKTVTKDLGSDQLEFQECFYSVYKIGDETEKRKFRPNTLRKSAVQWFKKENTDCPAIRRDNIISDDSLKKIFDGKEPLAFYMMGVCESSISTVVDKQSVVVFNCYTMESDGGNKINVLVVMDTEGNHIATVKDFDCSWDVEESLSERFFAFRMVEPDIPSYLALGARLRKEDEWCIYGLCLECEPKELRNIAGIKLPKSSWNEGKSSECPRVKLENIYVQEDGKDLKVLKEVSMHVMTLFFVGMLITMQVVEKETFTIKCYFNENGDKKYTMVILTAERRFLAMIDDYDCSLLSLRGGKIKENTYLYTLNENEQKILVLGTRSSDEGPWCRYNICLNCATKTIKRYIHEDLLDTTRSTYTIFRWLPEIAILELDSLLKKLDITTENLEKDAKPLSKFTNRKFTIECYIILGEHEVEFRTIIEDRGKRTIITKVDCNNFEEIKSFKLYKSKIIAAEGNDDDDWKIGMSLSKDKTCCSTYFCFSCTKVANLIDTLSASQFMAFTKVDQYDVTLNVNDEWVKVGLENCYALPEKNIYIQHKSELDLEKYEKFVSYISANFVDEDTYTIFCYKNDNLNEGERIVTRMRSLGKGIDVAIKNLDCSSKDVLTKSSYISVGVGPSGERVLIVGTRYFVGENYGPWCRYDICTTCKERQIRASHPGDPDEIVIFEWSEAGQKIASPGDTRCKERDTTFLPLIGRYTHYLYNSYNIECRDMSFYDSESVCSVITVNHLILVTIPGQDCLATSVKIQNFYLYTFNKKFEYSLIGLSPNLNDKQVDVLMDDIDEQWFYYSSGVSSLGNSDWRKVTNLNLKSLFRKPFEDGEVETKCRTEFKLVKDFQPTLSRREKKKKQQQQRRQGIIGRS